MNFVPGSDSYDCDNDWCGRMSEWTCLICGKRKSVYPKESKDVPFNAEAFIIRTYHDAASLIPLIRLQDETLKSFLSAYRKSVARTGKDEAEKFRRGKTRKSQWDLL